MNKKHLLCGVEIIFPKKQDTRDFLVFSEIHFGTHYFRTIYTSIYPRSAIITQEIELPLEFHPRELPELTKDWYFVQALVLQLYPETVTAEEIENYTDYVQSQCEMIVLAFDFHYVEIYCKNPSWLQAIIDAARKVPGASVEEKYEDTDPRTEMYV